MILSEKLISLIQKISSLELKEEDKIKWQSAYLEIFEKGYFIINRDNLEKLITTNILDSPMTTYGEVQLIKHIKRVHLDNRQLSKTCEIAVRFLDGCLDIINFSSEAKEKINHFRKIGLGVADFDAYCINTNQEQSKAIYSIGEVISNSAYRASEEIGDEKGFIPHLEESKSYNKGKIFAKFIHKTTNEVINGFELKKKVLDNKASWDDYSIMPRRNSHILLLPNQEMWYPYTDRVEGDYLPAEVIPEIQEEIVTKNRFSKGELVQIVANNDDHVYQVINYKNRHQKVIYTLKGNGVTNNQEWEDTQLRGVDLNYVLDKLNNNTSNSTYNNSVQAIILNNNDDKLLIDIDTQLPPKFVFQYNDIPEVFLINNLLEKYSLKTEILDEIGSAVDEGDIALAYWVNIVDGYNDKLQWLDVAELMKLPVYFKIFNKLNRKKKIFQQYESIIRKLETEKEELQHRIDTGKANSILVVHERPKTKVSLQDRINAWLGNTPQPTEYLRLGGGETAEDFNYDDQKYLLSLQQNIITDEFGTVKIIMEYSREGIKSIQLYPENFIPEERFVLDVYLELINIGLQYGVTKEEFAALLYKYEGAVEQTQLIEVIKLIRQSLTSAPATFNELTTKVY
jgi:Ribonucleotide reductase, barrel domain